MTCHKAGDLLSAYIEGELAERQSAALETHVGGCDGCREELETLRSAIALLAAPKAFARPEGLLEEFKEQYLPAAEVEAAPRWGFRLPAMPQFEWPSMGRVLLPMGGMAAAAAALMVALHTQTSPQMGGPSALGRPERIAAATVPLTGDSNPVDTVPRAKAGPRPGVTVRPMVKEENASTGRRDTAAGPPVAAPRNEPARPAERAMPAIPRSRRPRMIVADAAAPRFTVRPGRATRPMPLKAGERYADASGATPAMDEKAMAEASGGHKEVTPTLEDQWKGMAAVTLRRSSSKAVSVEEGYAEVSCRNVKTGEVKSMALAAPAAVTAPGAPAAVAPAEVPAPVETDETE
jgi:hypothetical protein